MVTLAWSCFSSNFDHKLHHELFVNQSLCHPLVILSKSQDLRVHTILTNGFGDNLPPTKIGFGDDQLNLSLSGEDGEDLSKKVEAELLGIIRQCWEQLCFPHRM